MVNKINPRLSQLDYWNPLDFITLLEPESDLD